MKDNRQSITIIGAGLNGPLLAISLLRRGFGVTMYERRPDMRRVQISAGRSINLAISTRGIHALKQAGLWSPMQTLVIPMRGRMMHSVQGELTFQPYGKDETEVINSISRADLNIALMRAAEKEGLSIHFQKRCIGYELSSGQLRLRDEIRGAEETVQSEVLIGCDGSASAIRTEMLRLNRFNLSQEYLDYGYKELTIPAGPRGEHRLEVHALHIWPRGNFMLIALPNIDGTFACILFLPFEGENSFEEIASVADVSRFFQQYFPDVIPLMPNLVENYMTNPTGSMVTVKCSPWHVNGRALLLGDAAHAIVPFFGQGINCGFEDCTAFLELLDRHGPDWPQVFTEFEQTRKINTDAIADMAVDNFAEMRDRVGDPRFLLRKRAELALEARHPKRFIPKYAMVTFHRVPYSVALSRGSAQEKILAEVCEAIDRVEEIDWPKADRLIQERLTPLEQAS